MTPRLTSAPTLATQALTAVLALGACRFDMDGNLKDPEAAQAQVQVTRPAAFSALSAPAIQPAPTTPLYVTQPSAPTTAPMTVPAAEVQPQAPIVAPVLATPPNSAETNAVTPTEGLEKKQDVDQSQNPMLAPSGQAEHQPTSVNMGLCVNDCRTKFLQCYMDAGALEGSKKQEKAMKACYKDKEACMASCDDPVPVK